MAKITERGPQRMILQSGSTTLILDKDAGRATMQRKLWFWSLRPMEVQLAEVASIEVDAGVDRASGVDVCNTMIITRAGAAWALPASDRKDAEATATAIGDFLGLKK
jgi:hypothetical protein